MSDMFIQCSQLIAFAKQNESREMQYMYSDVYSVSNIVKCISMYVTGVATLILETERCVYYAEENI